MPSSVQHLKVHRDVGWTTANGRPLRDPRLPEDPDRRFPVLAGEEKAQAKIRRRDSPRGDDVQIPQDGVPVPVVRSAQVGEKDLLPEEPLPVGGDPDPEPRSREDREDRAPVPPR